MLVLCAAAPARAVENQNTILGFPVNFTGYEATTTADGLSVKAAGAVDLSAALGEGALLKAGSIEIDPKGNVTLKEMTLPSFKLGPFEGKLAAEKLVVDHAATLKEPFLLDVTLGVNLNSQTLMATARLPITANGLADGEVTFSPPSGQENFLSLSEGDVSLVVNGGRLTVVGGKVTKATFTGGLKALGSELSVQELTLSGGRLSGHAEGQFDLDQVALALPQGLDFGVSQTGEISVSAPSAEFDFSGVLADVGKLSINNLSFQKGVLNAEASLEKSLLLEGVSLSLAKVKVTGSQQGVTATFEGSLGLEGLDLKADFTGFTVDSKGNVAGEISFDPPVSLDVSGLVVSVEKATFTKKEKSLVAALSGKLTIGEDTIKVTHLGVKNKKPWVTLGVSEQEPFAFKWLPYLKLTQLNVEDDMLTLGGAIDLPDPVKYTFSFKDTKIDLKNKKPTFSEKLEKRAKALFKTNTQNMVMFENTNTEKMKLGPLQVGLDAVSIPNPFATQQKALSSDTILEIFTSAHVTLGKTTLDFNVDGLAFSKEGLKDITVEVTPAKGLLADLSLDGIGSLKLPSAKVFVKSKKVTGVSFPRAKIKVDVPDLDLEFASLSVLMDGNLFGYIPFPKLKEIDLPGFGLSLKGIELKGLSTGFSLDFEGKLKFGIDWVPIKRFRISSLGWDVELDVSVQNPFKLSWLPYIKFSQLKLSKTSFTLGGGLDLPDLGNFKFSFSDVRINLEKPDLPVVFINTDAKFMTWQGLSIRVGSITLPNPLGLGKLPKTPEVVLGLSLSSSLDLLGKKIAFNIEGLNFTKDGLKDLSIDILPAGVSSGGSLFKEKLLDWAEVKLASAQISIKKKKLESLSFSGLLTVDGLVFGIKKLTIAGEGFKGDLTLPKDPKFSLGSLSLVLSKEVSFEIGKKDKGDFKITLKKVTLDATALLGEKAKLTLDTLTYSKGAMAAESSTGFEFGVGPFSLKVSKFSVKSDLPKSGNRVVDVTLDGNLKLSTLSLDLAFKNFKISSSGTVDGKFFFATAQSWKIFGFSMALDSIAFSKGKDKDPLVVTLAGIFKFADKVTFKFDNLKFENGKPVLEKEFTYPLTVDVKLLKLSVSKVVLSAGEIKLTGKAKIPVINVELSAKDFAFNSSGTPTGGSVQLDKPVSFTVAKFGIAIKKASIDITNKVFVWDADIELFGTKIPLKDLRISLGSSPAHDLTKKTSTKPSSLKIDLIGLSITPTSMDFGVKNLKFYFAFSGKIKILTSELDFTNLRIYQDYTFTVDEVKGKIGLAPFVVNIKSASFGEDFLKFTGDMDIPMVGTASVSNLKVSKTGVFLESATVIVEKPGFSYDMTLSWKDSKFTGSGKLTILKTSFNLSVLIETTKLTLTITGEPKLQLGVGLSLSKIKGTLVQKFKTEMPDIALSGKVVYLDEKFMRADVSMKMDGKTDYSISGEVTVLDTLKIAKMKIEGNISKGTFLASGNLNVTILDLVGLNVDIALGSTDKTVPSETKLKEPKKCEPSTKIFSKNPYFNCSLKKLEDNSHKQYRRDYNKELSALESELGPKWKDDMRKHWSTKKMCETAFKDEDASQIYQCALVYIWGMEQGVRASNAWLKAFGKAFNFLKTNKPEKVGEKVTLKCDSSKNCYNPAEYEARRWMDMALSACVDGPKSSNSTTRENLKNLLQHFDDCDSWSKPAWCDYDYKAKYNLSWEYRDNERAAENPGSVCYVLFPYTTGSPITAARALNPYDYKKGDFTNTESQMKTKYAGFRKKTFTDKDVYLSCDKEGNNCVSDEEIYKIPKIDKNGDLPSGETWEKVENRAAILAVQFMDVCENYTSEWVDNGYLVSQDFCTKYRRSINDAASALDMFSGSGGSDPSWGGGGGGKKSGTVVLDTWLAHELINWDMRYNMSYGGHSVMDYFKAISYGFDQSTGKFPGRLENKNWLGSYYWVLGALDLGKRKGETDYDSYLAYFFGGDPGRSEASSTPLRDKDFVTKFEASGTVKLMGQEFSVKVVENDKKLKFNANKEFDLSIVEGSLNVDGALGVGTFDAEVAAKLEADIPLVGEGALAGKASISTKTAGAVKAKVKLNGCMKITALEVVGAVVNAVSSWFGGPSEVVPKKICKKFDANVKISKDGMDFPSIKDTIKSIFK